MENNLLDREVLCVLDTRHIQRYIFRSNSMIDAIGGSDLINHLLKDAIRYSITHIEPSIGVGEYDFSEDPFAPIPYFTDKKIKIQQIVCTAGNAMLLFRSGALAQKIIRKVSRFYLEHSYNLDMAAAAVENTGNFSEDCFRLFNKLNAVKASSETLEPLGALPIVEIEANTGEPIVGYDEKSGMPISESTRIKRQEAQKRGNILAFNDISATKLKNGESYRAVIHADGNNMGITISKALQSASCYEEAIRLERQFSRSISDCIATVMSRTIAELKDLYQTTTKNTDGFDHEFMIVHRAGDDINCVCNARWAFPFVDLLYKNLENCNIDLYGGSEQQKSGNSDHTAIRQSIPLYVCTGIAIVGDEYDFHTAFNLAEECCANAKKSAKTEKNLRNGFAGNWIDYHVAEGSKQQELELLRERFYVTKEQVSLLCRPYCLDSEAQGQKNDYNELMRLIKLVKQLELTDSQNAVLRQSFMMGIKEFYHWISRISKSGLDLVAILGDPICWDSEHNKHATWYDAVELSDFIIV